LPLLVAANNQLEVLKLVVQAIKLHQCSSNQPAHECFVEHALQQLLPVTGRELELLPEQELLHTKCPFAMQHMTSPISEDLTFPNLLFALSLANCKQAAQQIFAAEAVLTSFKTIHDPSS
jgi:hypothetical protein